MNKTVLKKGNYNQEIENECCTLIKIAFEPSDDIGAIVEEELKNFQKLGVKSIIYRVRNDIEIEFETCDSVIIGNVTFFCSITSIADRVYELCLRIIGRNTRKKLSEDDFKKPMIKK